jgi:hypothetical protein
MGLNVFMRSLWLENIPKFCIIKVFMVICLPDNFSIAVFGLPPFTKGEPEGFLPSANDNHWNRVLYEKCRLRGGRGLRGRRPLVGGKLKAPFGAGVTF